MNLIRLFAILVITISSLSVKSQVEYLRLSPSQKIKQRVGATDVTIEFSRPQVKGRTIFGDLVPYDKLWRTGANENTKISFSHRVKIGETEIEEGTYGLLTKPNKKSWEIYFYTDTDNLDVPNPIDSSKLIYLTTVDSYVLTLPEDALVINIYDISETKASLGISWESTGVDVPIDFYTKEAMEKMISKEFEQNIFDYSIAASYYSQRNMDLEKAKKLQEIALELREEPSAWAYHEYGKTLQKLGENKKAIDAMEYSLKLALETRNEYLIRENTSSLNELKAN